MSSILIVDDRAANLRALEATLQPLGHRIVSAGSGEEALKHLLDPDELAVVLMDVRMPELDGFETVRMIRTRERTRRLPVIFISGYSPDEEIIAQSYGYGAVADFVLKPYNPAVLRAKVAVFVELHRMREELRVLARREAERAAVEAERRRLYSLLQKAPAAIAVLRGPEHVYEFANHLYARLAGGAAVGAPAAEIFPRLDGEGLLARLDHVYRTEELSTLEEARVSLDGEPEPAERAFSFVFQPQRDANGVDGVVVFGFDVTDQVHARALRERLLAVISHDLRNPLSAVSMGVDILLRHASERDAATLRRLQSSTSRMNRLIDQLLDFAAMQQGGGLRVTRAPIDVQEIVRQATDELNLAHQDRLVALEIDGDTHLDGDADRLAQVASNLIANAIVHGDGRGVLVRVHGGDAEVTVRVQNGGPHIPPELLPVIFEPFRRAADALGDSRKSLGLGLYIARQIVTAHEGGIEARSPDENKKTSFIVRLPKRSPSS